MTDLHAVRGWTVPTVLEQQALATPDKTVLEIEGERLTYGEAWQCAGQVANMLSDAGVEAGDLVGVMLPNRVEYCLSWFGLSRLGAVHVAINVDYVGAFLEHVLNNCAARTLIVDAEYLPRLDEIAANLERLEQLIVVGQGKASGRFRHRDFDAWRGQATRFDGPRPAFHDIGCVMYTSGTTGPSKGVLMPHAHLYLFGLGTIENMEVTGDDVFYIVLPLFHANGMFMQLYASMIAGATAVIRRRFSASAWIGDVVRHGATVTNSLGVVAAFVLKQPPSADDRRHRLRVMGMAPVSADMERDLRGRFGIPHVVGMYGMTEVNIPLYTRPGTPAPGSCGRAWDRYFEVAVVDPETDLEVPRGDTGEIVVRPKQAFGFMAGYLGMPDKTVEAWRNLWFHTGDAARMDEAGYVYFVDRIKDCIRRRGENISSFQVESVLESHPGVLEVAAYAVPSDIEGAEDEVMAAVVWREAGGSLEQLRSFAATRLPPFALPRYLRRLDGLPKTPTGKLQKHLLRRDGVTPDAVDFGRD